MKISIITACFNNEGTIAKCLQSIKNQRDVEIEHILIDGASSDNTVPIIKSYNHVAFFVSEKDKGIYDALNKGLNAATGDIVGFLHSDDVFKTNTVVKEIEDYFKNDSSIDAVYGDIEFVNTKGKKLRHYSSANFIESKFAQGRMPAHTSFFAKKIIYDQYKFSLGYKIAADFDHLLKVYRSNKFKIKYIPILTTQMLVGGASTKNIKARMTINQEILRSCKENGVQTNLLKIYGKYFCKIFEFKFLKDKVLVTGASGFVGKALSIRLQDKYEMHAISRQKDVLGFSKTYNWEDLDRLSCDYIAIIHLAGLAHDTTNRKDTSQYYDVNVGLTNNIIDWANGAKQPIKLIYMSSIKVYKNSININEKSPKNPRQFTDNQN